MNQEVRVYPPMPVPFHTLVNDGSSVSPHRHEYIEVFVVTQGQIDHVVNGEKERLEIGDMRILYPSSIHEFISCGESAHRDFLIRPDLYREGAKVISSPFFEDLEKQGFARAHLDLQEILFLEGRLSLFLATTDIEKRKTMEKIMVMDLLSCLYFDAPRKVQMSPFEQITIEAIAENFNKPDAYERIRKAVGYNDKYFCQKFKSCFGMNLVSYITKKRMDYANYLLKSTPMTIEAIVNEIGIESVSHFHKLYAKEFHTTPAKSRKGETR